ARLTASEGTVVQALHGIVARVTQGSKELVITLPSRGVHFAADAAAALETARVVLGDDYDAPKSAAAMSEVEPVFGRGDTVTIEGQKLECILVQNTSSFQLNIDALGRPRERTFIGVCDAEDDTSWLWTVRTGALQHVDVVGGPKAEAMPN